MQRKGLGITLSLAVLVAALASVAARDANAGNTASPLAAGFLHTCAVTDGGGLKCWGLNAYGALGDGTTTNHSAPGFVSGLRNGVSSIAAGALHTCAVTAGGGVKCWGDNEYGQLGDGTRDEHDTPIFVPGLKHNVVAVTAGFFHTCALTGDGGVECWGINDQGQLGDGTKLEHHSPAFVNGLKSGISAIAAGNDHTCAVTKAGGIKCWGNNGNGELGDGTTTGRLAPVAVKQLNAVVTALAAGDAHTCALTDGGGIKCWGYGGAGALGYGAVNDRHTPVAVHGLTSGVTAIAAGYSHSCALTHAGGVKCWGANARGQLGDGTTKVHDTPVNVTGLKSGAAAIAAGGRSFGDEHTCALIGAGGVKCWGFNLDGQLGDGTTTDRHTPVKVKHF